MLKTIEIKITYDENVWGSIYENIERFTDDLEMCGIEFTSLIDKREANLEERLNYQDGI